MTSWETSMLALFEDLEQQAAGLQLVERDLEVADLARSEYSRIDLAARLHASLGTELRLRLLGGVRVAGRVARVGHGWLLVVDQGAEWIVRTGAVCSLDGLSPRADHEDTWSVADRLSLRSVLRRVSEGTDPVLVHFLDDQRLEGRVGRVGHDFFELHAGQGAERSVSVVPEAAVAALQGRRPS